MTTQHEMETEWDAILEEGSDSVLPDSYLKPGEIINRPSGDNPSPMRVGDLRWKGYVEVWDTRTGDKSLQPWWLLWQTMRKTREDKSRVFTRVNPHIAPDHGQDLFCPLNPESPEYSSLKSMGFKACRKKHIPHEDGLMRHVRKSHSRAWEAMDRQRQETERNEDRQLQRDMLQAMTSAAVKGVASETVAVVTETAPVVERATVTLSCELDDCEYVATAETEGKAKTKLAIHQKGKYSKHKVAKS